jgi:hypothetical protein
MGVVTTASTVTTTNAATDIATRPPLTAPATTAMKYKIVKLVTSEAAWDNLLEARATAI